MKVSIIEVDNGDTETVLASFDADFAPVKAGDLIEVNGSVKTVGTAFNKVEGGSEHTYVVKVTAS